jgi:F-type H+-transporting ATPase subunit delta
MIDSAKPTTPAINIGALQVATVYAKALLGAAEKAGETDRLIEEIEGFVTDVLDRFPDLETLLASALVSAEEKSALIERVFGKQLSPLFIDFLKVLARHDRLDLVRAIQVKISELYDQLRGRVRVQIRTANPLADGLEHRLIGSLRTVLGGEPKLEPAVEPGLIGGIVLRVGDTVYDGSVACQLEQAREQMIHRSIHEIQSRRNSFRSPSGN